MLLNGVGIHVFNENRQQQKQHEIHLTWKFEVQNTANLTNVYVDTNWIQIVSLLICFQGMAARYVLAYMAYLNI